MKNLGIKSIKITISLIFLSLFTLTGCSDSKSGDDSTDLFQCQNQNIPVGIQGNTICPYLGQIGPNGQLQPYVLHFSAGIGFKIDFGWDYDDECPQDGQLAVFQNGSFSYCTGVNPVFAKTDFGRNHRANNFAECAGEQYNMALTGCGFDALRPSQAQYNW